MPVDSKCFVVIFEENWISEQAFKSLNWWPSFSFWKYRNVKCQSANRVQKQRLTNYACLTLRTPQLIASVSQRVQKCSHSACLLFLSCLSAVNNVQQKPEIKFVGKFSISKLSIKVKVPNLSLPPVSLPHCRMYLTCRAVSLIMWIKSR